MEAADEHARVCMLTDTLAWAVTHGISLADAVRTLPLSLSGWRTTTRQRWFARWLADAAQPWRPHPPLTRSIRWRWRMDELVALLECGVPLSAALESCAGRMFPGFFIAAVAHAERDGTLDTALPALARQLRMPIVSARQRMAHVAYQAARFIGTLGMFLFLIGSVVPRMIVIMSDLAGTAGGISPTTGHLRLLADWTPLFLLGLLPLYLLVVSDRFGEYVALRFPFLGRERRRWLLYELAASLAAFLRQGADIVTAAEWSMDATRSPWMQRRVVQFIGAIKAGHSWITAWQDIGLTTPMELWILRQAARREDPAGGFETVAEWGAWDFEVRARRLDQWIDPVCTLVLGGMVGTLAVWTWSTIIRSIALLL